MNMKMKASRKSLLIGVSLVCWIAASAQSDNSADKMKIKGLITGRTGETITVKTADARKVVVVLSDDTKIEQPKGAFGLRKQHYNLTSLVPGLAVEVEGTQNAKNQLEATKVRFSKSSLQTADAIQAGLTPTKAAVSANKQATQTNKEAAETNQQALHENAQEIGVNQKDIEDTNKRFSDLSDYQVKAGADVFFTPDSDKISDRDKAALSQLATVAKPLGGYIVQVKGYADSTGNAAMNQQLSLDRSEAVIAYLEQSGGIPVLHIVAPGAMGTSNPVASNETTQGRAENRRVDVKLLLNKGVNEQ
jgi:outer membrane protein OmpA-like peptidoglycan-associated protein